MVAKLCHQINAAAKTLEDVKNTLTPGLTRWLNKIFKGSMIQAELNAHREVLTIKNVNCKITTCRADEMKKMFNKTLQLIGIKPTKSTATQPQQDNSIESQPTVDSTPSNDCNREQQENRNALADEMPERKTPKALPKILVKQ
ncbi:hypothetical protein BDDG_12435 [Blastomyces dermatitidis ATCC 18188]|uniref:Uncharacterized protein n=1 Tax=Ajellomyces dermatitidis (strain ATCC 18188 / CBS 674.68) TaxID=653446 RepID=A0A0J9EPH0_AJEDA|nr:hypothetical protein BDDG_12435 [Blastomyces dermatitidis ATCC 18188]